MSVKNKAGIAVGDVSTVGRIANKTVSQLGDESYVFVAGQIRSVILDKGICERHAETDGTIDD